MDKKTLHKGVLREHTHSNTAILMIHGIFGSPNQFGDMAEYFYNHGYTTQTILLPGHGGTTKDFADVRAYNWRAYVKITVQKLKQTHENIVLMGHSMGGLLSIESAYDLGCSALVLIGTPTSINAKLTSAISAHKSVISSNLSEEFQNQDVAKLYSVDPPKVWDALSWSFPLIDLVEMCREVTSYLPHISVPVFICQSHNDTTIGQESMSTLASGFKKNIVEVAVLDESNHSIFTPEERKILIDRIENFLSRIL